jgi:hypothetical protein
MHSVMLMAESDQVAIVKPMVCALPTSQESDPESRQAGQEKGRQENSTHEVIKSHRMNEQRRASRGVVVWLSISELRGVHSANIVEAEYTE